MKALQSEAQKEGLKGPEVVKKVVVVKDDWTPENGLLTAAMKTKRPAVVEKYKEQIQKAFGGKK